LIAYRLRHAAYSIESKADPKGRLEAVTGVGGTAARARAAANDSHRQTSIVTSLVDDDHDLQYSVEARHVRTDDDLAKRGKKVAAVEEVVAVDDNVRTKAVTRLLEEGLARLQKSLMLKWRTIGVRRKAVRMKAAPRRTQLPTKAALATPAVETWRWTRSYEIMIMRNEPKPHTLYKAYRTFACSPGSRSLGPTATSDRTCAAT
jgi:hypothetical protein